MISFMFFSTLKSLDVIFKLLACGVRLEVAVVERWGHAFACGTFCHGSVLGEAFLYPRPSRTMRPSRSISCR